MSDLRFFTTVTIVVVVCLVCGIAIGCTATDYYYQKNPTEKMVVDEVKYNKVKEDVLEEFGALSRKLEEREALVKERENVIKEAKQFWVETGPLPKDTWILRENHRLMLLINPLTEKITQTFIDPLHKVPQQPYGFYGP